MASGGALQRVRRDPLPALKTEKSRCRVSSVVVAVMLGTALTRFGEAVRVFGVLHTLWRRSVSCKRRR